MAIAVEEAIRGKAIVWGAPTYDQVRIGMAETKKAAAGIAKFNRSSMTAEFPNGGVIHYRSLDNPDNARGRTADGIVIDESADVAEAAWYEVLRPMLIDTGGWLWAIGTPKGRNWFWREFVTACERPDSIAWNAPTLGCQIAGGRLHREPHPLENPHIPFEEMEHLYRTLPERVFRQEILGEFIEESGGVFRGVTESIDKDRREPDVPKPVRMTRGNLVLGVDLGKTSDFTVITVVDSQTGRQIFFDRFNQISWELQISRIKEAARRYQVDSVVVDSTGLGDPIYERLQHELDW